MRLVTRRMVGVCALIAAGGAVLWGGFVVVEAPYCEEAGRLRETALPEALLALFSPADDALSGFRCFEFWLNRYQALLAGLLVFCGGLVAAIAIHRQIGEAKKSAERQRQDDRALAEQPSAEAWAEFAAYLPFIREIADDIALGIDAILAESQRTAERDAALAALLQIDRYSNIGGLAHMARDVSRLVRYMRPIHAVRVERFQFLMSQTAQGLSGLVGHLNVADRPDTEFARILRERALRLSEEAAAYLGAEDWTPPAAGVLDMQPEDDQGLVA